MAESIEARIQRLEDYEAVRRTWCDYLFTLDSYNWDAFADVFTEDAIVEIIGISPERDGTYHGRRSIVDDFYSSLLGRTPRPGTEGVNGGHHGSNLKIELDGDEATTFAYYFVPGVNQSFGTYQHRMRREPDRWRMSYLRVVIRYHLQLEGNAAGVMKTVADVLSMPGPELDGR